MAFSNFRYPDVLATFGLEERMANLFGHVSPVPLGPAGQVAVRGAELAQTVHTEKARSEWIIGLLVLDLWERYHGQAGVYSGVELDADAEAGLNGFCDFLISSAPQLPRPRAPLVTVVEAKNDSVPNGYGQCIAGMVGLQRFNRKEGREVPTVYGCVTTGASWRFLTLTGSLVTFDAVQYDYTQPDRILGILVHIVGPIPQTA
jgi:hypothetical protein